MSTDTRNHEPAYPSRPGEVEYYPRPAGTSRLLVPFLVGALVLVLLGAGGGFLALTYLNRLDNLERSLATRRETLIPLPAQASDRQQAANAQSMTSNTSQPQIYFMMGGQAGGVPYQAASPYGNPGYYGTPVHYNQADIDQFMLHKFGKEYADHLKRRSRAAAPPAPIMPDGSVPYQAHNALYQPDYYGRTDLLLPFSPEGVVVPTPLSLDLRRHFTKNSGVEAWFRDQARENFGQNEDGERLPGTPEPDLDDILKSLAATNFADKNYERAARIYTELASRQVHLTKDELLQWAKAAELSEDLDAALKILDLVYQNYPEDFQVLKEMAALLVGNQRFAEAAAIYAKLMQADPDNREWRVMRANTLTWSNQGRVALPLLQELHAETPADWELSVMLAELLLSEHRFEEVLPLLDTMIETRPDDDTLKRNKIDALEALQRFAEAADMLEDLLTRHPEDAPLLLKLAKDRVAAQQFVAAIEPFENYLVLKPDDIVIREELADALMAAQSFSAAANHFGLVADAKPDDLEVKTKYANALLAAQDFDRASYVYSYLIEDLPGNRDIAMGYVVSLRMSGNLEPAYNAAMMHLSYEPGDSKMMIQAAEIAFELKDRYDDAIRWFRNAIRINGEQPEWRVTLGNVLISGQEYEAAEAEFRTALIYDPGNLDARRGLGRALFFQRKYTESWCAFEDLIRYDPTNAAYTAEYCYYRAIAVGMEDEAQKQLLVLIDAEPEEINWKGDRVQSLLRQHRFKEAGNAALVVYEDDPDYRSTRAGMRNMNEYLTSYPGQFRAGYLRKTSEQTDNPEQDRQANLTYKWVGIHGEGSYDYNWRIGADFDREYFGMRTAGVDDVKGTRLKMSATYEGNPDIWARGELGYRWLDRGLDDQIVYDVRGEFRELGDMSLNVGVYSRRREHYDNWMNVYDNLYAVDFGIDAVYRWKKWDFTGRVQGTVLNDNNSNFNLMAMARYRLIETPCLLVQVGPDIEFTDWKYTREDYFSPQEYWQGGVAIDGRYYLCRDPDTWGSPSTYVDFGLSMYRDRYSSFGQKIFLGVNHDYSTKLSLFARADYSHESYYDEVKLYGGLQYKFGGCEE